MSLSNNNSLSSIQAFECFDPHMSGFISQKQFREIFTELGGDKFSEREIRDLLKMAEGEDGQVFFFFSRRFVVCCFLIAIIFLFSFLSSLSLLLLLTIPPSPQVNYIDFVAKMVGSNGK